MPLVQLSTIDGKVKHAEAGYGRPKSKKVYYLGELCPNKHEAYDEFGDPLGSSLRYVASKGCVKCMNKNVKQRNARKNARKNDSEVDPEAVARRRRIEDLKLARELGVSVEELQ